MASLASCTSTDLEQKVHSLFSMNLRHFLRATSPYPTVGPTSGKNFEESMAKSWGGDAFYAFEDHGVDGDGRRVRVHRCVLAYYCRERPVI